MAFEKTQRRKTKDDHVQQYEDKTRSFKQQIKENMNKYDPSRKNKNFYLKEYNHDNS